MNVNCDFSAEERDDLQFSFQFIENMVDNTAGEIAEQRYRISDAAEDLKLMSESFMSVVYQHIHLGSDDLGKKISGLCVIYSLLCFLNKHVKEYHTFQFVIIEDSCLKDALSSHHVWDFMWRFEKHLHEYVFSKNNKSLQDLLEKENQTNDEMYAEIMKNPDLKYENLNVDSSSQSLCKKIRFSCLKSFYALFAGNYGKVMVAGYSARSKKQIYDCQCHADRMACEALKQTMAMSNSMPNNDIAQLIVKTAGGANNKSI